MYRKLRPSHSTHSRQKSGTRGDNRVCHWWSYHILKSSVICYWTDARQHGIYLFHIRKSQIITNCVYFSRKRVDRVLFCFWQTRKKVTIWRNLSSIQIEANIHRFLCEAKNFDCFRETRSCQTCIEPCRRENCNNRSTNVQKIRQNDRRSKTQNEDLNLN